jgi:hypothetical protein
MCMHSIRCGVCRQLLMEFRTAQCLSVTNSLHAPSYVVLLLLVAAALGGPLQVRSTPSRATTSHMTLAHMSHTGVVD